MQGPNTNTPAIFQGHPPIITPFRHHMCDIQVQCANTVHIAISLMAHLKCNSVEMGDNYIV